MSIQVTETKIRNEYNEHGSIEDSTIISQEVTHTLNTLEEVLEYRYQLHLQGYEIADVAAPHTNSIQVVFIPGQGAGLEVVTYVN